MHPGLGLFDGLTEISLQVLLLYSGPSFAAGVFEEEMQMVCCHGQTLSAKLRDKTLSSPQLSSLVKHGDAGCLIFATAAASHFIDVASY